MKPIKNKWYYTQYPGAVGRTCRCVESGEHASKMQCIYSMHMYSTVLNNCIITEVPDPRAFQRFRKKLGKLINWIHKIYFGDK